MAFARLLVSRDLKVHELAAIARQVEKFLLKKHSIVCKWGLVDGD